MATLPRNPSNDEDLILVVRSALAAAQSLETYPEDAEGALAFWQTVVEFGGGIWSLHFDISPGTALATGVTAVNVNGHVGEDSRKQTDPQWTIEGQFFIGVGVDAPPASYTITRLADGVVLDDTFLPAWAAQLPESQTVAALSPFALRRAMTLLVKQGHRAEDTFVIKWTPALNKIINSMFSQKGSSADNVDRLLVTSEGIGRLLTLLRVRLATPYTGTEPSKQRARIAVSTLIQRNLKHKVAAVMNRTDQGSAELNVLRGLIRREGWANTLSLHEISIANAKYRRVTRMLMDAQVSSREEGNALLAEMEAADRVVIVTGKGNGRDPELLAREAAGDIIIVRVRFTEDQVAKVLESEVVVSSLDVAPDGYEGGCYADVLPYVEAGYDDFDTHDALTTAATNANVSEIGVLVLRLKWGLIDGHSYTHKEASEVLRDHPELASRSKDGSSLRKAVGRIAAKAASESATPAAFSQLLGIEEAEAEAILAKFNRGTTTPVGPETTPETVEAPEAPEVAVPTLRTAVASLAAAVAATAPLSKPDLRPSTLALPAPDHTSHRPSNAPGAERLATSLSAYDFDKPITLYDPVSEAIGFAFANAVHIPEKLPLPPELLDALASSTAFDQIRALSPSDVRRIDERSRALLLHPAGTYHSVRGPSG